MEVAIFACETLVVGEARICGITAADGVGCELRTCSEEAQGAENQAPLNPHQHSVDEGGKEPLKQSEDFSVQKAPAKRKDATESPGATEFSPSLYYCKFPGSSSQHSLA